MSYHVGQFRALIERVLEQEALDSPGAVELLLGTAAQESQLGHFLRQIHGPALGAFQIEPATFEDIKKHYGFLYNRSSYELEYDLRLSIIVARLIYRRDPVPIPDAQDVPALAQVWKRVYNTSLGHGTPEQFVESYHRYVKGDQG